MLIVTGACCILPGCTTTAPTRHAAQKKLIEFGWDIPDTAFMRAHIAAMERTPFDGCVFHVTYTQPDGKPGNFMWECWSKRKFTDAELEPALADLKATRLHRFTENFLRFNTAPGDVDWFDDYSAIISNARLAARIAREGKARGVLFDIEQYNAPLFDYHKQRDAATKSWADYAAQARRRGREVMEAFQQGYPNLTVFLTFGYSLPWWETKGGTKTLAEGEYGLLAPFMDGMVEAARGRTRIVDGYENAYYHNKDITKFAAAYQMMTEKLLPIVADTKKYRQRLSVGFGLWLDFDSPRKVWNGDEAAKNFYNPDEFESSVRAALKAADEYVWIYSQTPRWWSAEGKPIKLPQAYDTALRRARQRPSP